MDLAPGSPEVVAQGCTRDTRKNQNGHGMKVLPSGNVYHYPAKDCPLHGLPALMKNPQA